MLQRGRVLHIGGKSVSGGMVLKDVSRVGKPFANLALLET